MDPFRQLVATLANGINAVDNQTLQADIRGLLRDIANTRGWSSRSRVAKRVNELHGNYEELGKYNRRSRVSEGTYQVLLPTDEEYAKVQFAINVLLLRIIRHLIAGRREQAVAQLTLLQENLDLIGQHKIARSEKRLTLLEQIEPLIDPAIEVVRR